MYLKNLIPKYSGYLPEHFTLPLPAPLEDYSRIIAGLLGLVPKRWLALHAHESDSHIIRLVRFFNMD